MKFILINIVNIIILCSGINNVFSQNQDIQKIEVYSYFVEAGERKCALQSKFNNFEQINLQKICVDANDLQIIQTILKTISPKKLKGDKMGIYPLYLDFTYTNNDIHHVVLIYDSTFIDLKNNCFYRIENSNYKQWVRKFQEKYRCKELVWK